MTTAEVWRTTDRLLPLGGASDGAWIAESAVRALLVTAARNVRGVLPGRPRFHLADEPAGRTGPIGAAGPPEAGGAAGPAGAAAEAGGAAAPDAPAPPAGGFAVPPGGLPHGELRVVLDFAAVVGHPLPDLSGRLRVALLAAAEGILGLKVAEVDLRITDLVEEPADFPAPAPPLGRTTPPTPEDPAAFAALAVPGVAALTDAFGPPLRRTGPGQLRVEVAVTEGHRPLDVVRAVRTGVTAAAPETARVTLLVSELR
ncbi:hypothetical protein ACIGO8_22155 [Streptomyces sp. NPDC053493]|uniref:hypothetical protein n=1 Tax=Streptomyces sp. NPDC053493 TaxID=3365705 RepID=UPI0037D91964